MIASICDRCGSVVEASGDDAPLAFYAQVRGEDAVVMDDLCPSCMDELRSMLDAFASNAKPQVMAENVSHSTSGGEAGREPTEPTGDGVLATPGDGDAQARDCGAEALAARCQMPSERPVEQSREMPVRIGTHSFSIPRTGTYTRASDQE